ncbi:MAG: extracellular solute-binding protein [Acidimicrobiia bacterium]|nr:extracellular solute-binding protein [Acidimicrobiia bacterium]
MTQYGSTRGSGRPTRLLTLVAVTVVVLIGCIPGRDDRAEDTEPTAPSGSLEVVLATSPEKLVLLEELATSFNAEKVEVAGKPVYVTVQKTSSGIGADLLVDDWPEGSDAAAGQRRPTIWSPSASLWGPVVNERRLAAGKPAILGEFESSMLTPVVIAMPEPMAQALGHPAQTVGWADIVALAQDPAGWGRFGHPEWGPFLLGKTNPNISTTGFNTTIAQAYAGAGKQNDLTVEDLQSPQVIAFLEQVESSIVHYGDTTLTFLENLYRADERGAALSYISAVAVEEKSVIDYNRGDPAGSAAPGEDTKPPRTKLVAMYPREGTLWSDNPLYVLEAGWVDDTEAEGAAKFQAWVVDREASQERVLDFGFRPANPDVAVGPPIDAESGLDPLQPQTVLPVPPGPTTLAVLDTWDSTRKAARVLLVLDVSGSMGDPAGAGSSATKLDFAKQAAISSLDMFNDEDEVGLWVFSTELEGKRDWRELAPIEPIASNRPELERLISGLSPQNGTGLYDTAQAAVEMMRPRADREHITAVVLLTDGMNDDFDTHEIDALIRTLEGGGELRTVRVFTVGYGEDADVEALTRIAEASDGAVYISKDPANIERVFSNVISNF